MYALEADPRNYQKEGQPEPVGEVKEVRINGKKFKLGKSVEGEFEAALKEVLARHLSAFAWSAADMTGINPDFLGHRLYINPHVRPIAQQRRKFNDEKRQAIREEVGKLVDAGHIREIQYLKWLSNVVMVKKSNGKWRMCVDFTDLNSACLKDCYPLPNISILVDNASGHRLLSFIDAFSGYNQIRMHPSDEEKTAFMAESANYCYKVMPFGLKNVGATYQRLMDKILQPMFGRNVHAYVDDMVVTSPKEAAHLADLEELFCTINECGLKLNPEKCVFDVCAGKFLGFLLTKRGIEANPDKCATIIQMKSPTNTKEVKQLTGRMAALSRFLSASGDKGYPYFSCLRKNERFQWTEDCEEAFRRLKEYLAQLFVLCRSIPGKPLRLYLCVTDRAINSVIVQDYERAQKPVYYVSKVLQGAETRYQSVEKAALAVVLTARRLRHYFQGFTVITMTDLLLRQVLGKPDLAGRLVKWAVELSEFDIRFEPRGPLKGQFLVDFVAEMTPDRAPQSEDFVWNLSVDGASNLKGSGAGIILEGPQGVLLERALRFSFKTRNNQAEYEALIAGILLAQEMGVRRLLAKSDSQLIVGQITGNFQAKDPHLALYLNYVKTLADNFTSFELTHVPREQNSRADLLSKLATSGKGGTHRTVIQETMRAPRVTMGDAQEECVNATELGTKETWMTPYALYLSDGILPTEPECAKMIRRNAKRYTLLDGHLFRSGYTHPLLTCVDEEQSARILFELHEGSCESHIGGRALSLKAIRAGYYWPTMKADCHLYAKNANNVRSMQIGTISPHKSYTRYLARGHSTHGV